MHYLTLLIACYNFLCRSPKSSLRRASSTDTDGRYDELKEKRHLISRLDGNKVVSRGSKVDSGSIDLETPQSLSPKSPLEAMLNSLTQSTGSLPRKLPTSPATSRKPVPQPRTRNLMALTGSSRKTPSNSFVKSADNLDLELDSLDKSNSTVTDGSQVDSVGMDEQQDMDKACNNIVSKAKDEIHDYSEIYTPNNENGPWTSDKPPTPPLHRFPSWESRIYQVRFYLVVYIYVI